jgi:SAM-dependent methyltransferase
VRIANMVTDLVRFRDREERARYILTHFGKYFGRSVLDMGCDAAPLRKLVTDVEYTGVDISGTPDIFLDVAALDRLPFDDSSFDCVICADFLEHIDDLHAAFSEVLRVSRKYVIVSWPNCWAVARVPIQRGYGRFKHYGLPVEKPPDRHKWFFSFSQARHFVQEHIGTNGDFEIAEERLTEKPKFVLFRAARHLRYPNLVRYANRYVHTYWTVLRRIGGSL